MPSGINRRYLSPLWTYVWLFQKSSCTCEFLGEQYEWQKLLKEKRRTFAYETAQNTRK
jgi:hypothetical protein